MAWTAPATQTVGAVLTAAWLNTYVRDNMNHVYGSIATFSPTLTQSGSVTLTTATGRYRYVGNTCYLHIALDPSGTGTGANAVTIGNVPAAIAPRSSNSLMGASSTADVDTGTFQYFDSGTALYDGTCTFISASTINCKESNTTAGSALGVAPNFAVAAADSLNLTFPQYETAAASS